jgi:ABC-type branched-subunit amino acid transport system ATPase component
MKIADHHCIMENGRVVWQGSTVDLAADESLKARYLGV